MDHKEYKQLTKEEEIAAWERGDFNALVESVMPFVIRNIRRFAQPGQLLYDELVSQCNMQLTVALQSFDPHQTRFITYGCDHLYERLANRTKLISKRQARNRHREPKNLPDRSSRTVSDIDAKDASDRILAALKAECSEDEYASLVCRLNGDSFKEIASKTGKASRQAAQQTFKRAITRARDLFPSLAETGA